MALQPRLRMFAGPNGSGKSTLKSILDKDKLGVYVNPDEISRSISETGLLDFKKYSISVNTEELRLFFESSSLLKKKNISIPFFDVTKSKLLFSAELMNGYYASVLSDFIRQKLLKSRISFTFETVMSDSGKVEFLKEAQALGYRTYLYFVATENPKINIARVAERVKAGGHFVPEDKIIARYFKSLELLHNAIRFSNRAYIFDNSAEHSRVWLVEITDGVSAEIKQDVLPLWLTTYLFDKF